MFVETFFKGDLIARYLPDILKGMAVTVEVAAAVVVTGIAFGLALAIVRSFRLRPLNAVIVVYVDIMRALPPLVLLLSACASKQQAPQLIPALAETRQCPTYPLPPANLLKPPARTDFLTPSPQPNRPSSSTN